LSDAFDLALDLGVVVGFEVATLQVICQEKPIALTSTKMERN
jgi:hypothetical protein